MLTLEKTEEDITEEELVTEPEVPDYIPENPDDEDEDEPEPQEA